MSLALATLAVLSIAADPTAEPSRLAVVDAAGTVLVNDDTDATWRAVHRCPLVEAGFAEEWSEACAGSPAPAAIAWVQGSLYLACSQDTVFRWESGALAARPAGLAALPGVVALGVRDEELLIADEDGAIWSYRPGHQAVHLTEAPEPPIAIAGPGEHIALAGASGVWQWTSAGIGQHWTLLSTARACAMAAAAPAGDPLLWLASAHGLLALHGGRLSVRLVTPVIALAIAGDVLLAADGHSLFAAGASSLPNSSASDSGAASDHEITAFLEAPQGRPAGLAPDSGLRIDWRDLSRRARRARWIPRLSAGLSYQHSNQRDHDSYREHRAIGIWVWLTWPSINHGVLP
jgi:hypothetical protein